RRPLPYLCALRRRALVAERLRHHPRHPARHLPCRLPHDAGAADGRTISLALRKSRVVRLAGQVVIRPTPNCCGAILVIASRDAADMAAKGYHPATICGEQNTNA